MHYLTSLSSFAASHRSQEHNQYYMFVITTNEALQQIKVICEANERLRSIIQCNCVLLQLPFSRVQPSLPVLNLLMFEKGYQSKASTHILTQLDQLAKVQSVRCLEKRSGLTSPLA